MSNSQSAQAQPESGTKAIDTVLFLLRSGTSVDFNYPSYLFELRTYKFGPVDRNMYWGSRRNLASQSN